MHSSTVCAAGRSVSKRRRCVRIGCKDKLADAEQMPPCLDDLDSRRWLTARVFVHHQDSRSFWRFCSCPFQGCDFALPRRRLTDRWRHVDQSLGAFTVHYQIDFAIRAQVSEVFTLSAPMKKDGSFQLAPQHGVTWV